MPQLTLELSRCSAGFSLNCHVRHSQLRRLRWLLTQQDRFGVSGHGVCGRMRRRGRLLSRLSRSGGGSSSDGDPDTDRANAAGAWPRFADDRAQFAFQPGPSHRDADRADRAPRGSAGRRDGCRERSRTAEFSNVEHEPSNRTCPGLRRCTSSCRRHRSGMSCISQYRPVANRRQRAAACPGGACLPAVGRSQPSRASRPRGRGRTLSTRAAGPGHRRRSFTAYRQ